MSKYWVGLSPQDCGASEDDIEPRDDISEAEIAEETERQLAELRDVCVDVAQQLERHAGSGEPKFVGPYAVKIRGWARKLMSAAYKLPEDQV